MLRSDHWSVSQRRNSITLDDNAGLLVMEGYSPSTAFEKEQEAKVKQADLERLREELADENSAARKKALDCEPPATVQAYMDLYGREPKGWPPV